MKIMGLSKRKSGVFEFRMNIPRDLHKKLNKTCHYHDLGYDPVSATKQAMKLRNKYKILFKSLRQQMDSSDTGTSVLSAHGIHPRQLVGDEVLFLPDTFEEATQQYETYEDLPEHLQQASKILRGIQTVKMSDVLLRHEKETSQTNFRLPVRMFIELCGDLDVTTLRREHAYMFRDELVSKNNAPATQKKRLGALSRLMDYASKEFDLSNLNNPFSKINLVETKPVKVREALTIEEHKDLLDLCLAKADERRIALSLICVTGARLSEATGLLVKDVHINEQAIDIFENPDRSLKTKNSRRSVPCVNADVWKLVKAQIKDKKADEPVFPTLHGKSRMNSVSATLVKFIKTKVNEDRDVHSIRHTVATRLKNVLTPDSLIEDILGWKKSSMLGTYAGSVDLEQKRKWLRKALA